MGLKRLIILLSVVLVLSPVSAAYASLFQDFSDEKASHCKHTGQSQTHKQDKKSCCDEGKCGPSCLKMHCAQPGFSTGMIVSAFRYFQPQPALARLYEVKEDPGGGWPSIPLRPPINIL